MNGFQDFQTVPNRGIRYSRTRNPYDTGPNFGELDKRTLCFVVASKCRKDTRCVVAQITLHAVNNMKETEK